VRVRHVLEKSEMEIEARLWSRCSFSAGSTFQSFFSLSHIPPDVNPVYHHGGHILLLLSSYAFPTAHEHNSRQFLMLPCVV